MSDIRSVPRVLRPLSNHVSGSEKNLLPRQSLYSRNGPALLQNTPLQEILIRLCTAHWFTVLGARIPDLKHHVLSLNPPPAPQVVTPSERVALRGRCMQIRALKVFPIEAIVRGYLAGSAWNESVWPYLRSRLLSAAPNRLTFVL